MTDIPTLETERLLLVPPGEKHLAAYTAFAMDAERSQFLGGPKTRMQAWLGFAQMIGHWALRGYGRWVVEDKASGAYLGHVGGLHPDGYPDRELAWSLAKPAEGRGVAFEAAMAARAHAYAAWGWTSAISLIDPDNARSRRLAERMGAAVESTDETTFPGEIALVYRHPSPATLSEAHA